MARARLIVVSCIAGIVGVVIGAWWGYPALWLFLYSSGIGARLKTVRLPRKLEKLVPTLDYEFLPVMPDSVKALYFTVGGFETHKSASGILSYYDVYDFHPGAHYSVRAFPGLAIMLFPFDGRDSGMAALGKRFVTTGNIFIGLPEPLDNEGVDDGGCGDLTHDEMESVGKIILEYLAAPKE